MSQSLDARRAGVDALQRTSARAIAAPIERGGAAHGQRSEWLAAVDDLDREAVGVLEADTPTTAGRLDLLDRGRSFQPGSRVEIVGTGRLEGIRTSIILGRSFKSREDGQRERLSQHKRWIYAMGKKIGDSTL